MSVDFAFLDSGIGGIPYLLFLQEKQPNVNCIYYADTKNFPYGQKSTEQIIENATIAAEKLFKSGILVQLFLHVIQFLLPR